MRRPGPPACAATAARRGRGARRGERRRPGAERAAGAPRHGPPGRRRAQTRCAPYRSATDRRHTSVTRSSGNRCKPIAPPVRLGLRAPRTGRGRRHEGEITMRLLRRLVQLVIVAMIVSWVLATMSDVAASPSDGPSPFGTSGTTTTETAPGSRPPLPGPQNPPAPEPGPGGWDSWTRDPSGTDHELADPGAVYADGAFHAYGTSSTQCVAGKCGMWWVPRFTSPALDESATPAGDAMPDRPAWVPESDRAIWAPSVAHVGDRYVLYFAATAASGPHEGHKCLGAAQSASPTGPFVPEPHPVRCEAGLWSLAPSGVDQG